jgi:putative transposase
MILPKEYLRARHPEVEGEWLMFGIPFEIWMDNANEFIGNRIASVAAEMNAELQWCPAKQPWWKGGVERFIRTFSHALIHAIPGTTFESIRARGDYDPEKDALITLQDLEMIIHKWIVDVYHNAFHHGLGTTPKLAWNEGALIKEPAMVADVDLMHIAMGDSAEITLQHYGIQIFSNQRFNSPELGMFARTGMLGAKVKVKFHHSDLTKVYVLDKARNQYLVVPNIDPEPIVGLNLEQHLDILKRARDLYANSPDREAYLRAKRDIRVFFDELLRSRRVRNRRRAARMRGDDSGSMRRRAAQSEMDRKMRVGGGGEPQSGPQASDAQDPGKSHSPKPAPSSAPNSEPANDDGWGDMQPIVEQPKPDQNTGASSNV